MAHAVPHCVPIVPIRSFTILTSGLIVCWCEGMRLHRGNLEKKSWVCTFWHFCVSLKYPETLKYSGIQELLPQSGIIFSWCTVNSI